jgi:23S rRNA (uracil1939-C5)-methyltransferase
MFKIGTEIELEIRDLSSQGEGVGSFEGMTVFVEGALIGERVLARVSLLK